MPGKDSGRVFQLAYRFFKFRRKPVGKFYGRPGDKQALGNRPAVASRAAPVTMANLTSKKISLSMIMV